MSEDQGDAKGGLSDATWDSWAFRLGWRCVCGGAHCHGERVQVKSQGAEVKSQGAEGAQVSLTRG